MENDLAWKGSLSRHKSGLYLLVFIALKCVKSQNRLPFHTTDQVYIFQQGHKSGDGGN